MRLLVPDAMPIDLLPEPESRRLEWSFGDVAAIDDAPYAEHADDFWRRLRRYELDPAWHCERD